MRVLIKLGGTLLEAEGSRRRLAREITAARRDGAEVGVVHGGGKQLTTFLKERGIESHFVNGLRVTSAAVLASVSMGAAGRGNQVLARACPAPGAEAVGLTGADALLTEAEPLDAALVFVGRPVRSNGRLLRVLTAEGYLPVVACVAGDRSGALYNVNADQMAVACAIGFGAEKLFFFTDVEGVLDAEGRLCESLDEAACGKLIESGEASGGMRAKLEAALGAVRGGVGEVIIAGGAREGLARMLLGGERVGTRIVA